MVLSFPIAVVKALISLLHCYCACQMLGEVDVREREAIRQKELGKKAE